MVALLMTEISKYTTTVEKRVLKVWATKNFIKDKMTGRVDILWCIFENIAKKYKNWVTGPKNVVLGKLIWICSKICAF